MGAEDSSGGLVLGKKLNLNEMQQAIRNNWNEFQNRMQAEWYQFNEQELAEAKDNLHSFMVQVERRSHESADSVKAKLQTWRQEITQRPPGRS